MISLDNYRRRAGAAPAGRHAEERLWLPERRRRPPRCPGMDRTATAEMAGLNVLTYLTAYLDACGRNDGKPLSGPDLERFLPWNPTPGDLRTWAQPPPPG